MKTNLITREGFQRLKDELDFLCKEERPEVTKKITGVGVEIEVSRTF